MDLPGFLCRQACRGLRATACLRQLARGKKSDGRTSRTAPRVMATSATLKIPVRSGPTPRLRKSITSPSNRTRSIRLPSAPLSNSAQAAARAVDSDLLHSSMPAMPAAISPLKSTSAAPTAGGRAASRRHNPKERAGVLRILQADGIVQKALRRRALELFDGDPLRGLVTTQAGGQDHDQDHSPLHPTLGLTHDLHRTPPCGSWWGPSAPPGIHSGRC